MVQEMSFIHPEAKIGANVEIGPFVYIDKNVEIGDGCLIMAHATILSGARIGKNVRVFPNAVISAIPQDLKFRGEETTAVVGDNTTVRECVTINRGTASKGTTIVGSNCLLMAYSHIAHDCKLGNNIIIGNATQIAGEVVIDDWAILSGGILIHQFSRIGAHVIVQGGSRVGKDVPPYVTAGRDPLNYVGLNIVGLRRRGFTSEQIDRIQSIYRYVYQSELNTTQAIEKITSEVEDSDEKSIIVDFIKSSQRGIIRG
ncbi:MAG: acyl-ACP--UDP-N-acetylglucosamine O-acyltransferase [Paludibacteraceae bacterium]|nr:acyl-ACP--UDP-N-acetylglucosamine O-acyltransferase [Paludibacteraceae bacterium]MBO7635266.1 acyl-ACP--UDP-N-acetylglucosamine O-acyltransferase [Paludibacteraceae bacterium]